MKPITNSQSIFSHIILPLISLSSLFGQTIDLGTLSANNIQGFSPSPQMPPEEAFNGISTGESEGWLASSTYALLLGASLLALRIIRKRDLQ